MSEKPPASHEKISHWDRPKPPRDWRWVVGGIGRTLITIGLLMFAFVGYQLWGTGIQTAQAQRTLSAEFDETLASVSAATSTTTTTTTAPPGTDPVTAGSTLPTDPIAPTTTTAPVLAAAKPIPDSGKGVARLEIPRMGLNRIVVEGATVGDLTKGPGHFPETPLPGQLGNAAIAGHRTTHLAPFFDIDKLQPGDEIIVTTLNGRYLYRVTGTEIVAPQDYALVIPTTDFTRATLTLVSCTPRYTAKSRIIVRSELVPDQSDALTEATPAEPVVDPAEPGVTLPDEGPVTVPDDSAVTVESAVTVDTAATTAPGDTVPAASARPAEASPDAFSDGWFSDTTAIPQSIMWGLALAAVAFGIRWVSRRARRYWVGVLAGFVPFIVVLYFFYENVNRLLPPNL
ncbi:MAG: class E sortase [Actinomycetota bacterium]|nr:class E sortase [Actinomycetota bacterium]